MMARYGHSLHPLSSAQFHVVMIAGQDQNSRTMKERRVSEFVGTLQKLKKFKLTALQVHTEAIR